jgi:DNA-3-methyladenine glycosylase
VKATDRLRRDFYTRPTLEVARDLLGRVLCRRPHGGPTLRGSIIEVEAYDGPHDRASHAFRGPTARNRPMFELGGIAYVYQIYGVHFCLNVVTGEAGYPAAILIRATEPPADGLVATGPGRLTRTYGIDRTLDGASLLGKQLWLETGSRLPDARVRRTRRIGVDYAEDWAERDYRFIVVDHDHVSGPRRLR